MREVSKHQGPVWTFIYSLKREDATRLGYDSAESWRGSRRWQSAAKFGTACGTKLNATTRTSRKEYLPISRQKEFRAVKNMVIQEAEHIHLGAVSFEDERMQDEVEEELEAVFFSPQAM